MNRATKALAATVAVLTVTSLILAYLCIDRSISLAYSRQSAESASSAMRGLERVLEQEWRGWPEVEVLERLQATFPRGPEAKVLVKKDGTVIWLDEVSFNVENGRLKSIGPQ